MSEAEFDRHAQSYRQVHSENIAITGESPEYFADYKMRDFAALLGQAGVNPHAKVLDFGSGIGASVQPFLRHLPEARLTCADVSAQSLALLQEQHGVSGVEVALIEGERLPFDDGHFDAAFACCVFHHIAHKAHVGILRDLRRVVKPGGVVMIYEHNPFNPLTVRAVRTCPLDENAELITAAQMRRRLTQAGYSSARIDFRVFFPASLRALRGAENHLRWLPLGGQYFAAARV